MYCAICGDENGIQYYVSKKQSLCKSCAADTPRKVSYNTFVAEYFKGNDDCPESTKREFYSDYKASKHNVQDYIEATTKIAM